jgi:hypothetical protein
MRNGCRDAIYRVLYHGRILFSIKIGIQFKQDAINRVSTKLILRNSPIKIDLSMIDNNKTKILNMPPIPPAPEAKAATTPVAAATDTVLPIAKDRAMPKINTETVVAGFATAGVVGAAGMMWVNQPNSRKTAADLTIYRDAPVATDVRDEMPFAEAFETARAQVGQGGTFLWKGKIYHTYTTEEWNKLSPDEQKEYNQSVHLKEKPSEEPVEPHPKTPVATPIQEPATNQTPVQKPQENPAVPAEPKPEPPVAAKQLTEPAEPRQTVTSTQTTPKTAEPKETPAEIDKPFDVSDELVATPKDVNGNGVIDSVAVADKSGQLVAVLVDANENKVFEGMILDTDKDGVADTIIVDTDEDGKWDEARPFNPNEPKPAPTGGETCATDPIAVVPPPKEEPVQVAATVTPPKEALVPETATVTPKMEEPAQPISTVPNGEERADRTPKSQSETSDYVMMEDEEEEEDNYVLLDEEEEEDNYTLIDEEEEADYVLLDDDHNHTSDSDAANDESTAQHDMEQNHFDSNHDLTPS